MRKELEILQDYIEAKGLRNTPQRELVLKAFLATEKHLSVAELHKIVKRNNKTIGYTTVYRIMQLLMKCGLCEEIDFGDGTKRYEHSYKHKHHDHLVCTKCGRFIEIIKPEIEKMQEEVAKAKNFTITHHKLQIFGICEKCKK